MKCWMQTPVFKEPGSSGHGVVPKDHGLLAELFLPDRRKINTTTKRAMNFVMVLKKGCQSVATLAHNNNRSTRLFADYAEKR